MADTLTTAAKIEQKIN